jgi:hypothetical protein
VVTFDVPSWADAGDSFARFRLSTAGGLGVTGFSSDGEVEDHLVNVSSPAPGSRMFSEYLIATGIDGLSSAFAADVDGDGDMDVFSASSDRISWYENGGLQNFTPYTVTTASNPNSVFAADVDGDLDMDALFASDEGLAWTENDGSQNFTKRIINSYDVFSDVFAADLDGNGHVDAISYSEFSGQGRVYWYKNCVSGESIATASNLHSAFAADMDGQSTSSLGALLIRVSLPPTWTVTAIWTRSPPHPAPARSPGTRTTACRTLPHTPSPPPPTRTVSSPPTWTATAIWTPSMVQTKNLAGARTTGARTLPYTPSPPAMLLRYSPSIWTATAI